MAQKRARTQACKKHKMGNVRKKNWQGILQKINLFLPKAPVSSCWWRLHGMAWDSSGPRFRSPNKNYFTTEYKIKCRLCNDIYLVLSAEVTGVLIGQSEAEVGEDVGEDQEHLTFIDQFHFPINRNLCSVIFVLPSAYFYCLLLHVYDFKGAQIWDIRCFRLLLYSSIGIGRFFWIFYLYSVLKVVFCRFKKIYF